MPKITVSDPLYKKLEEAASDDELESALWEMVFLFQRGHARTD